MSELTDLIAAVGDESPVVEQQVFRLWASAEDVLGELDKVFSTPAIKPGHQLANAMMRLRESVKP